MVLIRKNKNGVPHLNQIYILIKNKKLISYCIIFEANILIEMVICMGVDCKSDKGRPKFS